MNMSAWLTCVASGSRAAYRVSNIAITISGRITPPTIAIRLRYGLSHLNNFGLGKHGRNRSNVWTYAGANTFRVGRMDDLAMHPTVYRIVAGKSGKPKAKTDNPDHPGA